MGVYGLTTGLDFIDHGLSLGGIENSGEAKKIRSAHAASRRWPKRASKGEHLLLESTRQMLQLLDKFVMDSRIDHLLSPFVALRTTAAARTPWR